MTHITEDTVTRLREQIVKGVRMRASHFQDHRTPLSAGEWHTADDVSFDESGRLTVTYHWYTEGGKKKISKTYFDADAMVALADPNTPQNPSRLILPGGYMIACAGGNLHTWDVYRADGTQLGQEVTTVDARAMLDAYAPEMVWVRAGNTWTARGNGRAWKIEQGRRNPDFDAHTPLTRTHLFNLLARPLDAEEWETLAVDLATAEDAKALAPRPQQA
ncbi:hypothetical protein AB0E08_07455 [Streptomyces sp. NPDC048281]|uniref:hypothetical protein n=1 Tax=Streptomyces sp. NPDC048281 TaxID=3154715 RepID=UPI003444EDFE